MKVMLFGDFYFAKKSYKCGSATNLMRHLTKSHPFN